MRRTQTITITIPVDRDAIQDLFYQWVEQELGAEAAAGWDFSDLHTAMDGVKEES